MLERVVFYKANPNENTTILVINAFPRNRYKEVALKLMTSQSVSGEQVGFIEPPDRLGAKARLHMMGDEFCANALAVLAAYYASQEKLAMGGHKKYRFESSGVEKLIQCVVQKKSDGFNVIVEMPLPKSFRETSVSIEGRSLDIIEVGFKGMSHVLVSKQNVTDLKRCGHCLLKLGEMEENTLKGVTFFHEENHQIESLIYVKGTDTETWESSCGMASAAYAIYKGQKLCESTTLDVMQPSGKPIRVHLRYKYKRIHKASIEQDVVPAVLGMAYI